MTPVGADGQRGHGKGKGNALPSDYVPPGGVRTNMRDANTLGGSLSGSPALNAAASGQLLDAESLKAKVETLRLRLRAQQATNCSLAEANEELIANVETMRQEDIESDSRASKSRRKTKSKTKVKPDPKGGESSSSRPEPVGRATERRDQERKLRKKARKIRKRPSWPAQHPQLRTPTCRPRTSQARPVGELPLRHPTPGNPRVPRRPRCRSPAPSLRTRHRTLRLDDPAWVRTRVVPTLRSGWRKPIGLRSFDPPTVASSPYWTIVPTS